MKPYQITISQPGGAKSLTYSGLFANDFAAIESALENAPSPLCGIRVKACKP